MKFDTFLRRMVDRGQALATPFGYKPSQFRAITSNLQRDFPSGIARLKKCFDKNQSIQSLGPAVIRFWVEFMEHQKLISVRAVITVLSASQAKSHRIEPNEVWRSENFEKAREVFTVAHLREMIEH